jgi:hypothetical protein
MPQEKNCHKDKKIYIEWADFGSCPEQSLPIFTVNKKNCHHCLIATAA